MKKLILAIVGIFFAAGLFAQTIKSKEGYKDLRWGATISDVKKEGYKLVEMGEKDKQGTKEYYLEGTEAYFVANSERILSSLSFYFYNGKLFQVIEEIPGKNFSLSKLQSRYGNHLAKVETSMATMYTDTVVKDGVIIDASINVMYINGLYLTSLWDFSVYSKVNKQFAKANAPTGLVGGLKNLAEKLVQTSSTKPTYAFIALTSDDGNALVENYVTDALTEAMFETGKIKIVERASIEKIMSEQKFQSTALVNESTAVEIGNLSGANYVCYGTVKDLGEQISLNVKVVEVSTAELCAMGRETIAKDKYLSGVGYEMRKTYTGPASASGKSGNTTEANTKKVANNQWKVEKVRNDFDECTVYTFTVTTPTKEVVIVGLKKYDNPMYSSAWCGFSGFDGLDTEIKGNSGNSVKMFFNGFYWYFNGHDGNWLDCVSSGKKGTKWLFDICLNSDIVSIRDYRNKIGRFQTAGLEEKIIEAGLTVDDFLKAYANEDF